MILLLLILFVSGFVFPPLWLGFAGVIIYLLASRKSRRSDAVELRIKKMVAEGNTQALSSDLYFEAARAYAIAKGAKAAEKNSASTYFVVDGQTYFVVFTRATDGGTILSVEKLEEMRERMFTHLNVGTSDTGTTNTGAINGKPKTNNTPVRPKRTRPEAKTHYFSRPRSAGNTDDVVIAGQKYSGDPKSDQVGADIVNKVTTVVLEKAPTELDMYRYIVEETDRFSGKGGVASWVLLCMGMKPLEYEGEIADAGSYPENRAALEYLNDVVTPDLVSAVGMQKADDIRAMVLLSIFQSNAAKVNELRLKYAVHFANKLSLRGSYEQAGKWDEVIDALA